MPIYDKTFLTERARRLGFLTAPLEKTIRLASILSFINDTDELKDSLALKGGTAINLAVFDLPRLSVDVDLDFTINLNREDTRKKRDRITELLKLYMAAEGYTEHSKSKNTHILDSFVYSYTNAAGNTDNIKVEINYSLRCHIFSTIDIKLKESDIFVPFTVRILAPMEIFASKIVALSDRAAPRDLFDINNMIYYKIFNEEDTILLRKCAVFYLAITGDVTSEGLNFKQIEGITPYKIKTDLLPMLRNVKRFDLQEACARVSDFISSYMKLSEEEAEFLRCFAKGSYRPELLFGGAEMTKRIENHPMALWRQQHIRERKINT